MGRKISSAYPFDKCLGVFWGHLSGAMWQAVELHTGRSGDLEGMPRFGSHGVSIVLNPWRLVR